MLFEQEEEEKEYATLLQDAIAQIPLYSKEWTNYNVSDPGITILENLTAFYWLQQLQLGKIKEEEKRKLLEMLGFFAIKDKSARVLLSPMRPSSQEEYFFPAQQRFYLGELCFETRKPMSVKENKIQAIFTKQQTEICDVTYLTDPDIPVYHYIFGKSPCKGMQIYFLFAALEQQSPITLYFHVEEEKRRTAFQNKVLPFADLKWECYTETGWEEVLEEDQTNMFLKSGEILLQPFSQKPVLYDELEQKGYAIRCTLQACHYDIPPKLNFITASLFEVWQQETRAASFFLEGAGEQTTVEVNSMLLEQNCIFVYVKETENGHYYLYQETAKEQQGRYYTVIRETVGKRKFQFDQKKFGYGPVRQADAICIVAYTEQMVHHRLLGEIYGYEKQKLKLDDTTRILAEKFLLLIEEENEAGEKIYSFVKPNEKKQDAFGYQLFSERGEIEITNPYISTAAKAYVCQCIITQGAEGNIRSESKLQTAYGEDAQTQYFQSISSGHDGHSFETTTILQQKFLQEMKKPTTAVLPSDYETIVRETPGLCIHKVKAILQEKKNQICIVVKPNTKEAFPKMSALYREQIQTHLENYRMLTTRIKLLQPKYIPIGVQAMIYVKNYLENTREAIEQLLKQELDYIHSDHNFGSMISFHQLFQKIEQLPCVESIYEFHLYPQVNNSVRIEGEDIYLAEDSLCYPGTFQLEINAKTR